MTCNTELEIDPHKCSHCTLVGQRQSLQQMILEQLDIWLQKQNQELSLSTYLTLIKESIKDHRPKVKHRTMELLENKGIAMTF